MVSTTSPKLAAQPSYTERRIMPIPLLIWFFGAFSTPSDSPFSSPTRHNPGLLFLVSIPFSQQGEDTCWRTPFQTGRLSNVTR